MQRVRTDAGKIGRLKDFRQRGEDRDRQGTRKMAWRRGARSEKEETDKDHKMRGGAEAAGGEMSRKKGKGHGDTLFELQMIG